MSKVGHKQCKIALILGWRKYGCTSLCCSSSFFLSGNEFNFESRYLKKNTQNRTGETNMRHAPNDACFYNDKFRLLVEYLPIGKYHPNWSYVSYLPRRRHRGTEQKSDAAAHLLAPVEHKVSPFL